MYTRSSKWEEYKDLSSKKARSVYMKKYNNLFDYGRWTTKDPKDPKDAHILVLVVFSKKLMDNLKKTSNKSNR